MTGYLIRSVTVLNLVLFCAAFLFGCYIVLPPFMKKGVDIPPAAGNAAGKDTAGIGTGEVVKKATPDSFEYMIIAEQNLFHPARKIPAEKKDAKPLPKPEFVLYGVLITDDTSLVYIEDRKSPRNTPGRGTRPNVLRRNDRLSGFILTDIKPDRVVMVRGEEKITVPLNKSRSKKQVRSGRGSRQRYQSIPPGISSPNRSKFQN